MRKIGFIAMISSLLGSCCVQPYPRTYISAEIQEQKHFVPECKESINALKEENNPSSPNETEGQLSFY